MKTEKKNKSQSLSSIKIEETDDELRITAKVDYSNLKLLGWIRSTLSYSGLPFLGGLLYFVLSISKLTQVTSLVQALPILCISGFALFIMGLSLVPFLSIILRKRMVTITQNAIFEHIGQTRLLCSEPFKAVYIRATSNHKKAPFSVIMRAKRKTRVQLFSHLTHEQAAYIARVINQYLKLDASQEDFFEPLVDQHPHPDERDVDQHHPDSGEDETLRARRVT